MKNHASMSLLLILTTSVDVIGMAAVSVAQERAAESSTQVVLASEIDWGALNPARGDKGPKAANLWGDRTGSGPSGFLVRFVDGFESPPHIHNITYRGVVIRGQVHNDDPDAAPMWMPSGSYWTQPAGEVHITAARGPDNLVYVEIGSGPYLVLPTDEAVDNGERPLNVHESNIVWQSPSATTWIKRPSDAASGSAPQIAFLWGDPQDEQPKGTLLKLPAGFAGRITSHGSTLRAVVVAGKPKLQMRGETEITALEPGSYFGSQGESVHQLSSDAGEKSIIYLRTDGAYEVIAE